MPQIKDIPLMTELEPDKTSEEDMLIIPKALYH